MMGGRRYLESIGGAAALVAAAPAAAAFHQAGAVHRVRNAARGGPCGEPMVLLDLLRAPPRSALRAVANALQRMENLSHVLAWGSTAASIDVVELPRLGLTFVRDATAADDAPLRLRCAELSGMYLAAAPATSAAMLERVQVLARGLSSALLMTDGRGNHCVVASALAMPRPVVPASIYATSFILERNNAAWERSVAVSRQLRYYRFDVHPSGLYLVGSTSLAPTLYLLLMRLANREYALGCRLCASIASDAVPTAEELQLLDALGVANRDSQPDAAALRLHIFLATASSHSAAQDKVASLNLAKQMYMYLVRRSAVSAACRLSLDQELALLRRLAAMGRPNASDAAEWRTVLGNRTAQLEAMRAGELEYALVPHAWATAPNARGPFYDTVEVGARGACAAAYLRGKAKLEKREGAGRGAQLLGALSAAADLGKDMYGKVTSLAYARPGGGDAAALAANYALDPYRSVELVNALLADGSGGFRRDLGFAFLYELHTGSLRLALVPADGAGGGAAADGWSGAGARLASVLQRSAGRRTWQASNVEMCVLRLLEYNPSALNAERLELTGKGLSAPGIDATLHRACAALHEKDAALRDGDGYTWPAALGSGLLRRQELSQRLRRGTWSAVHKRDLTLEAPLKARTNVSRARVRSMNVFGATAEGLRSAFTADDAVAFTTAPLLPIGVDDFVAKESRASLGLAAIVGAAPFDLRCDSSFLFC